jgi:hypothetical protein
MTYRDRIPRAAIKDIADKQRRANDKVETEHEPVEQLAAERRLRLAELWEAAERLLVERPERERGEEYWRYLKYCRERVSADDFEREYRD